MPLQGLPIAHTRRHHPAHISPLPQPHRSIDSAEQRAAAAAARVKDYGDSGTSKQAPPPAGVLPPATAIFDEVI